MPDVQLALYMPTRKFKKPIVWLLIVIYALVFGEFFVRLFAPVPIVPRYVTGAPYGVRVGMPNMDFWQTTLETRAHIHTNSRGIRANREFSYEKPPGVCRILLFGDSFFVGYEVNYEDSFAYLLDQKLKAAGYHCDVINMAVSGFGTAEMLITLKEEGLKYQPDIVVFSSNTTDLDDNIRASLFGLNAEGELVRKNQSFLPGIKLSDQLSKFFIYRWLAENSQLYSAVRERSAYQIKDLLLKLNKSATQQEPIQHSAENDGSVASKDSFPERLNLKLLDEAKRVTEMNHAHFTVLEIPESKSRTEFVRGLPDYDSQVIQDLNIINPLPVFKAAADPAKKIYFEKGHGHLTPLGNHLLTDYFFSQLKNTGWLN
jgi:hypothetical protein